MSRLIKYLALAAVVMTALTACDDHVPERAMRLSESLADKWQRGDTEALATFKATYDGHVESLSLPWSRHTLEKLFIENVEAHGNDTLTAAARAVALEPADFADFYAGRLLDSLRHSATITPEQALSQMTVVGTGAGRVGAVASAEAYSLELDRRTRELPVDEQMRVYARAAITPEELGRALAEEYRMPEADTALVRDRLDALREIYDAPRMARCEAEFNRNIN